MARPVKLLLAGLVAGMMAPAPAGALHVPGRRFVPPQQQAPARVAGALVAPVVRGTLTADIIRRVIYVRINEIRSCYQIELLMRPALTGRVAVRFIIDDEGRVAELAVRDSSIPLESLLHCVADAMRKWEFPATHNGGITQVTYPFVLRPRPVEDNYVGVKISDAELESLGIYKEDGLPAADILF